MCNLITVVCLFATSSAALIHDEDCSNLYTFVARSATEWRQPVAFDDGDKFNYLGRVIGHPELNAGLSASVRKILAENSLPVAISLINDEQDKSEVFDLVLLTSGLNCLASADIASHFGISRVSQEAISTFYHRFKEKRSFALAFGVFAEERTVPPLLLSLQFELELACTLALSPEEQKNISRRLIARRSLARSVTVALNSLNNTETSISGKLLFDRHRDSVFAAAMKKRVEGAAISYLRERIPQKPIVKREPRDDEATFLKLYRRSTASHLAIRKFVFGENTKTLNAFLNDRADSLTPEFAKLLRSWPAGTQERFFSFGIGISGGPKLLAMPELHELVGLNLIEADALTLAVDHYESTLKSNPAMAYEVLSSPLTKEVEGIVTDILNLWYAEQEFLYEMPETAFVKFETLLVSQENSLISLWAQVVE